MQIRRRGCALAGLILFVLSMIPRPALSQLVEISVQLDVLRAGPLNDGCFGVFCITTDTTVEAFGTITVDRVTVQWNKYPCGAGWGGDCLAAGPLTTDVREFQRLSWREQSLSSRGEFSYDYRFQTVEPQFQVHEVLPFWHSAIDHRLMAVPRPRPTECK